MVGHGEKNPAIPPDHRGAMPSAKHRFSSPVFHSLIYGYRSNPPRKIQNRSNLSLYIYIYKVFTKSLSFLGLLQPSTPAAGTWVDIIALLIHRIKDTFFVPIKCHMFAVFAYSCYIYRHIYIYMYIQYAQYIHVYIVYIHMYTIYIYIYLFIYTIYIWLCYMSTISKTIFIWFISYSSPTSTSGCRRSAKRTVRLRRWRASVQLVSWRRGRKAWCHGLELWWIYGGFMVDIIGYIPMDERS